MLEKKTSYRTNDEKTKEINNIYEVEWGHFPMHSTEPQPAQSDDGPRQQSDRLNSNENGSKATKKKYALWTEILFPSDTFEKTVFISFVCLMSEMVFNTYVSLYLNMFYDVEVFLTQENSRKKCERWREREREKRRSRMNRVKSVCTAYIIKSRTSTKNKGNQRVHKNLKYQQ